MIKFKFSLEKVLKVRGLRVKLTQKSLADAILRHQSEQARLDQTMGAYQQASETLCQRETSGITAGDLRVTRMYLDRMAEEVALREGAVKAALVRVDEVRDQLVQAMKDHKSLERFKEKRFQTYHQEAQRQEQKILDEVRTR